MPEHDEGLDRTSAVRFRLDVAYDGSNFRGWARQPGLRTVQGVIEEALGSIFQRHAYRPTLVVAGRTDAGVHANGQVTHVDIEPDLLKTLRANNPNRSNRLNRLNSASERRAASNGTKDTASTLARRLTGLLNRDQDVVIKRVSVAPPGFDARFSAVWRRYQYRLADSPRGYDPLQRHRTTWHRTPLDQEAMDAAAATLVGLHDFAAYCKPREGATTIRTLQEFRWRRDADDVLVADIAADAFCHSMVRALVGGCAAVGAKKLAISDLTLLRDAAVRTSEFKVLAARGLTLMEVGYPHEGELALRAEQTRARRDGPAETYSLVTDQPSREKALLGCAEVDREVRNGLG